MSVQFKATVTRNSNGSVDLRPSGEDATASGIERVTIHAVGNFSPKRFAIDDQVEVSIEKSKAEPVKVPAATRAAKRAQDKAEKATADAAKAARAAEAANARASGEAAARRAEGDGN